MLLRRHNSSNFLANIDENVHNNNTNNSSTQASASTSTSSSQFNFNKSKLMMSLMKSSCPTYFEIPRSTRKRILRFLCDNGWIDVS